MAARRAELSVTTGADRVRDVFCHVVGLPPAERAQAARRLCGGDAEALREVSRLLAHADVGSDFLRPPERVVWRDPKSEIGRTFGGRWRLVRLLGVGATGTVYEVHDVETGRRAALKLVRGLSEETIRGVRREIALLRWLRLPGVVHLIDDGSEEDAVFCVTEIVDGAPFPGPGFSGSWKALEPVALGLLEAVARVHAAGVVHCDLKPANVLVDARGVITILDLGISAEARAPFVEKRTRYAGGTEAYAAPEQWRGATPDVRWDVYSLGVMLFEALADRCPGAQPARECADLPAPRRVRRVIASLLAPRRTERPRSVRDVLRVLHPPPPARIRRTRWTESELRGRFAGPDLLLHLREDAAAELFRRTAGQPRDVEHEIASWIRSGLAREDAGVVVIERPALERLRTLPSTRARRAGPDAPLDGSFARILRRGTPREVAQAARRLAARRLAQGRPSSAMAVLFEGASGARAAEDRELELRILCDAAAAAVRTAVSAELDRALLVLQRASSSAEEVRDLETVLRAAVHYSAGRPRDALQELVPICGRSTDDDVLRIAWSVRSTVSYALGIDEERRCLRGLRQWLRRTKIRAADGILATTEGWLRFHEAQFGAAVRLHLRAAEAAADAHGRSRCLLDAATAAVECRPADARVYAAQARRIAASLRNPVHEGRALHVGRLALVRSDATAPLHAEFVEAASRVGFPGLAAGAAFTEAVLARRNGDPDSARRLAMTAARTWGAAPPGDAARALAASAGEPLDDATLRRCRQSASQTLPPAVGMQVLALLGLARPKWRAQLRRELGGLRLPPKDRDESRIREVMSIAEARQLLTN